MALVIVAVTGLAGGCAGGAANTGSARWQARPATPGPPDTAGAGAPTGSFASDPLVSDGTASFAVTASPVSSSVVVTAGSLLWSASPGQAFLVDTFTVQNSTSSPENLDGFDDPTSGLARNVDFAMSAADAATFGFASDCGADPGYPASLCPVSFAEGLVVDSNSAAHPGAASATLAPGASARIGVSYGPVSIKIVPGRVAAYFHNGAAAPDRL